MTPDRSASHPRLVGKPPPGDGWQETEWETEGEWWSFENWDDDIPPNDEPPLDSYASLGDRPPATPTENRPEPTPAQDPRYRVLMPDDMLALPATSWRVRHVLPAAGLATVYGTPKSGKSFLVLHLLDAITGARSWFGYRTTPCHVLCVELEGEAGIPSRLRALQARRGALPRNLAMIMQPFDIRSRKDRDDLVLAAKAAGYKSGILVIDTLNRAAPGMDENDSASMGAVIAGAKALQEALGGLVLLVHHSGKDASKGPRGHSSLSAAVDVAIEVCRDGDRRDWKIALAKDGPDAAGHGFRLEVVEIGTDPEDGEPITSCVVVPDESSDASDGKPTPPKGGNQRIVLDALHELLRDSRDFGKAGAPITRPCVRMDDAITATKGRLLCEQKRQGERATNALRALVARGNLGHNEGWLWLA